MDKIIECKRCKGTGVFDISHYDGHKGGLIGDYITIRCDSCDGTGLLEETTTITLRPYHSKKRVPTSEEGSIKPKVECRHLQKEHSILGSGLISCKTFGNVTNDFCKDCNSDNG